MMRDFEKLMLSQMMDIDGLHEVSSFPLAKGYLFLVYVAVILFLYFCYLSYKNYKFKKSWKFKFLNELDNLEKKFRKQSVKQSISEFNDLLKRYCLKMFDRKEVASLTGKKWLKWLTLRDKNGFDWSKRGDILINFPYMPEEKIKAKKREVIYLIKALKEWV
jgi:hypothetical protein